LRVIGEGEFKAIYERLMGFFGFIKELLSVPVDPNHVREGVADYARSFGQLDTIFGKADIYVGSGYGYRVLKWSSANGVEVASDAIGLFFFELVRLTGIPMGVGYIELSRRLYLIDLDLYRLQESDGYFSAFSFLRTYYDAAFWRNGELVEDFKRERFKNLLNAKVRFSIGEYLLNVYLQIDLGVAGSEGLVGDLVGLLDYKDEYGRYPDNDETVFRRLVGSVLLQLDGVLRSEAYERAKDNVLGLLAVM